MKTVMLVSEENHGLIGVARNYEDSVIFLIRTGWLANDTEVYVENMDSCKTVYDLLGEDWEEIIINDWTLEKFTEFFDGVFYIEKKKIFTQ